MAEGLRALPETVGGQGLMAGVQGGQHEGDNDGSGMGGMAWRDSFLFFLLKKLIRRAERGIKVY